MLEALAVVAALVIGVITYTACVEVMSAKADFSPIDPITFRRSG
jgi:hypothetical protein